jgi:hypothetical protein
MCAIASIALRDHRLRKNFKTKVDVVLHKGSVPIKQHQSPLNRPFSRSLPRMPRAACTRCQHATRWFPSCDRCGLQPKSSQWQA